MSHSPAPPAFYLACTDVLAIQLAWVLANSIVDQSGRIKRAYPHKGKYIKCPDVTTFRSVWRAAPPHLRRLLAQAVHIRLGTGRDPGPRLDPLSS